MGTLCTGLIFIDSLPVPKSLGPFPNPPIHVGYGRVSTDEEADVDDTCGSPLVSAVAGTTGLTRTVLPEVEEALPESGRGVEEAIPSAATTPTKNVVETKPVIRDRIFRIKKRQKISVAC